MSFHSFITERDGWKTLEATELCSTPYLKVRQMRVATPTRPGGVEWTVVHRKAACVIVPVLEDGRLLLVRQERVPVRGVLWEFPAGQIDSEEGDFISQTGIREMEEETGYGMAEGARITPMGHFFTSPGMTDELCHLMQIGPVTPLPGGARHEGDEAIVACRAVTPETLRQMIAEGEIRDANSLSAFARMVALGAIPQL